ncbi:hypothetical protein PCANC_08878 [Puccinia coronata f. sp. avenae]|uniref:Uncharacterized protein n=2 Tax=Puccinia coronata f. sp. avenae TaxID=200324 RepID=A0A2N5VS30_9BASI|nr:hypothetical protein PCANC_15787 [Puccinia coronata f. sp. avenae]PLW52803.1 hypothetical protein PCANC_08878 [Puccinia coronata f. sp. avenae]
MPRPFFLVEFLLCLICDGALIDDDASAFATWISPDALNLPDFSQPIPVPELQTSHSILPGADVPTAVVSTSSQELGRLHSSCDPTYVPGGLSTHFTAHHPSVSSNYQPDFGFNGYFEEPSGSDQFLEEYLRMLEDTSEVPRDDNPNPISTSQSAYQETQTAQDVGHWQIHNLSGISDDTLLTMTEVPSIFNSPSSFPRDLQMLTKIQTTSKNKPPAPIQDTRENVQEAMKHCSSNF